MGARNLLSRVLAHRPDQSDGSFVIIVAQALVLPANAPKATRYSRSVRSGNSTGPHVPAVV
jgi:hypothetical protein